MWSRRRRGSRGSWRFRDEASRCAGGLFSEREGRPPFLLGSLIARHQILALFRKPRNNMLFYFLHKGSRESTPFFADNFVVGEQYSTRTDNRF